MELDDSKDVYALKKRPFIISLLAALLLVAYLFYASHRIYKRLNSKHQDYSDFVVTEYEIKPLDIQSQPAPENKTTQTTTSKSTSPKTDLSSSAKSNQGTNTNTNTTTNTNSGTTGNTNTNTASNNQNAETDLDEKVYYKGGPEALHLFLNKNMVYPVNAKSRKIEGTILVSFTVELDGTISNISTDGRGDADLTKEAIRVIKLSSGNWIPGKIRQSSVRSICRMPIEFQLSINDF